MNDEFQWWLLLVGLVIGALLVFLVMVDFTRSADEQTEAELIHEADWIAGLFAGTAGEVDPALVQEILRLNRDWLAGPAMQANEGDLPAAEVPPAEAPLADQAAERPSSAPASCSPEPVPRGERRRLGPAAGR